MEKRERTFELKAWMVVALLGGALLWAIAQEEIILTTYYPSPRGVYHELRTAGDVRIGDIEPYPSGFSPRLHVIQGIGLNPTLRVDDAAPDLFGNYDPTPFLIDDDGDVGIGTETPGAGNKLDVQGGNINTSGKLQEQGNPLIPAGAVMYFNLADCPAGWSPLVAAQGRYLVGVSNTATVGGVPAGTTALANLEKRAAGKHDHNITDNQHSHFIANMGGPNGNNGANHAYSGEHIGPDYTDPSGANIDILNTGPGISSEDTNAPYIQFLVCQKN
jgi:hypothetical protein